MSAVRPRYNIPKVAVASFKSQALRDAACGAPCFFLTEWCHTDTDNNETTVLVHSDHLEDGNGWGCKGHDADAAAGCRGCHQWYESKQGTDEERREVMRMAHKRWWRWLLETGRAKIGKPR